MLLNLGLHLMALWDDVTAPLRGSRVLDDVTGYYMTL